MYYKYKADCFCCIPQKAWKSTTSSVIVVSHTTNQRIKPVGGFVKHNTT